MTLPTDLQSNPDRRGPYGTELMGVSVAIPLKETLDDDGVPWSQTDWEAAVRHYQPQMLEMLRRHVGGAQPRTEPGLAVDGPHDDPLQGQLYVMTASAWFSPLDLPLNCPAEQARRG